jgi:uncharacterized protein (TIGR04222 family)
MRRSALVALAAAAIALAVALPAAAQDDEDTGWTVTSFDADLQMAEDGSVTVSEEIAVDFADRERHGIFRVIPVAYAIPEDDPQVELPAGRDPDEFRRILQIDGIEVSSDAPADVETSNEGDNLVLRIGDEDETVTGQHTYRMRYAVRGALNATPERVELDWDVTGTEWPVPIQEVTAVVEAPSLIDTSCAQGPEGEATPCGHVDVGDGRATFAAEGLQPGEGLTVSVALAPGAVAVPPPMIQERWTLPRALAGNPVALPLAAVMAAAGLGSAALLARRGRDEAAPETASGLRADPPEGLRPAQLAVLLDERVDAAGLSATLADLAARGYLDVEQVPPADGRQEPDWRLRRRSGGNEADLLDYERELLGDLFARGETVTLSDLKGEFSDEDGRFRDRVYADAVGRGWFPRSPAATRARWLTIGFIALVVSGLLLGLALIFTTIAIAAVPLVLAALALLVVHRWMPHRTSAGRRLLDEARGYRAFLTSGTRLQHVDPGAAFTRELPYAIAFGLVPVLVSRFAGLGLPADGWAPTWYHYPAGYAAWGQNWHQDLGDFAAAAGGGLSTAPASTSGSSGTFSGGGFGGGGGGSW